MFPYPIWELFSFYLFLPSFWVAVQSDNSPKEARQEKRKSALNNAFQAQGLVHR